MLELDPPPRVNRDLERRVKARLAKQEAERKSAARRQAFKDRWFWWVPYTVIIPAALIAIAFIWHCITHHDDHQR